ncbi:MAG: threonine synthase [Betaproteobacteria bacterium RIFCSPLOWO2_02_FULL_67_26]|nr:MAG: threonine synthase [Betaproteobacteria bacterium RIFCSPLOWO2_02_FULL_67_26]
MAHYSGLIDKYRDRLPVAPGTRAVSLNEGATPLIELVNLPVLVRKKVRLYAKFEGLNPTGSFKDRGMTMAVTRAVEEGARAIICASTGNTSAAAAAYAARAGIACFVLIPEGKIALGKLSQAMMHGSVVIQIRGNFDDGMRLVQEVARTTPVNIVNSINPYRIQGQKTVAFEVIEALGDVPDYHALPVGNAGNITAHWIGYSESVGEKTEALKADAGMRQYKRKKIAKRRPIMLGYQASGAAPIVRGRPVENPETVATAIRIGNPVSWQQAVAASHESGGWFAECTDEEILHVQKLLAQTEGIFCEPASAIALAGVLKDLELGKIGEGSIIVCTLTGHGLKDPDVAIAQSAQPVTVDAELPAIERVIRRHLPKT